MTTYKNNERSWSGQIIAWMKAEILAGHTKFQDANNDASVKVASGRTLYPDILLFTDKVAGLVLNGWELKFPETHVDDEEMLLNALEKAEALSSNSFVTWNGAEAVIWGIKDKEYSLAGLSRLKTYPPEVGISKRKDLREVASYKKHELKLQERLREILADLEKLHDNGEILDAINISSELIAAVGDTGSYVIPQIEQLIRDASNSDKTFRDAVRDWKQLESSTLKILANLGNTVPENILARFIFYKLTGKIIFYLTLQSNLPGKLPEVALAGDDDVLGQLQVYFDKAREIDYQAVFGEADFTDGLTFNSVIDASLFSLITSLTKYDFSDLPTEVVGNILENLVPVAERKQFGQYFSPEVLAYLVAYPVIDGKNSVVLDPTAGTGTFLTAFYNILRNYGKRDHSKLLNQVWGNDISHFPAILSVINLYKLNVDSVDSGNYPRVVRSDFFTLNPGDVRQFPDNSDSSVINDVAVPSFDAIASNFPFVQQEDTSKASLTAHFQSLYGSSQPAFLAGTTFRLEQRADYYTYCFYQSLQFLKPTGQLAAITSNAWLGKNYGLQLKQFLLDNFHIRYVVQSDAEHWFENAQVRTVYVVLQRGASAHPTRFVTLRKALKTFSEDPTPAGIIRRVADFYDAVDTCERPVNAVDWAPEPAYPGAVYEHRGGVARVSLVPEARLRAMLTTQENWESLFVAPDVLSPVAGFLVQPTNTVFRSGRGTRTGQDRFFMLSHAQAAAAQIEAKFLRPILKNNKELKTLHHTATPSAYLFVCDEDEATLCLQYPHAYKWVQKGEHLLNEKNELLPHVLSGNRPHWYTLRVEPPASIFIAMNPDKRLFFSYTDQPGYANQRLAAIRPVVAADTALVAALLNSVVGLLLVELNGTARHLGALDLNADFFKTRIKMLDPARLSAPQRKAVLAAFAPLSKRPQQSYTTEFQQPDRQAFDDAVLAAYGLPFKLRLALYELLTQRMEDRVTMKDR